MHEYKRYIREVQDFPTPDVNFKDISPLLADNALFRSAVGDMGKLVGATDAPPDYWIGIDARGFVFASALAQRFGGGILLCRKQGKLPPPVIEQSYTTEYSNDTLALPPGAGRAVLVDDVLATGGTLSAAHRLAHNAGYSLVAALVLIDLRYLPRSNDFIQMTTPLHSLIHYD